MTTAAWPLQVAIVGTLDSDDQLGAVVTGVHDEVPEDVAFPYITVGQITEVPDDDHNARGVRATVTLHIWSKYRGFRQALEILGHVDRLLDRRPLAVAGFRDASIAHDWHETMRDPDPEIRHVPVRYRVWLNRED